MSDTTKMARLGDILLEKGLLSATHLQEAVDEQQRRRKRVNPDDKLAMEATSLGEVLIDLGYITRQELKRGLNWQLYLRNMTLVMSLCAPLMSVGVAAAPNKHKSSSVSSSVSSQSVSSTALSSQDTLASSSSSSVASSPASSSSIGVSSAPEASSSSSAASVATTSANSSSSYDGAGAVSSSSAPSSEAASSSTAAPPVSELPLMVQAEDYTAMSGIEVEPTTDIGGGMNVGYIHEGDWLSYSGSRVNIPVAGTYKLTFRVASPLGGGSFAFHEADGSIHYATVNVPATGGSQTWVDVEQVVTLAAGVHSFGITALTRGSGFNINWFKLEVQNNFQPVTIQAEDFSDMFGIETEPTVDSGGGLNVGYIHVGDWMLYANNPVEIPVSGAYRVVFRVASPGGGGRFSFHELDQSVLYDTVDVPNTGSSQTWVDVTKMVYLTAGIHKFGITALERGYGFNINWFRVESDAAQTSSSASSVSSQVASSQAVSAFSSSSAPASVGSSSAPSVTSSSSSSASSVSVIQAAGSVYFQWNTPTLRENGEPLADYELGGYEIRYRQLPSEDFIYITLDAWRTEYLFDWLEGRYQFEIAAFDINGLYSRFVPLVPSGT